MRVEIALHSKLDHENIIRFFDSLQVQNMVYLLLEFAPNNSLFFSINGREGLSERLALRFLYFTAKAVKYLHQFCILHRDIKPENILLDAEFNVKLCDFGWAAQLKDAMEVRRSVCGTYEYMPPEVMDQGEHSFKSDIWGLGILLIELMTGAPPYSADSLADLKRKFRTSSLRFPPKSSPETRELLRQLLRPAQNERPSAAQVLAHPAFRPYLESFETPLGQEDIEKLRSAFRVNREQIPSSEVDSRGLLRFEESKSPTPLVQLVSSQLRDSEGPAPKNSELEVGCNSSLMRAIDHLIYKGEFDEDVRESLGPEFQFRSIEAPARQELDVVDSNSVVFEKEPPRPTLPEKANTITPLFPIENIEKLEVPFGRQSIRAVGIDTPFPIEKQAGICIDTKYTLENKKRVDTPFSIEKQRGARNDTPYSMEKQRGVGVDTPYSMEKQRGVGVDTPYSMEKQKGTALNTPFASKNQEVVRFEADREGEDMEESNVEESIEELLRRKRELEAQTRDIDRKLSKLASRGCSPRVKSEISPEENPFEPPKSAGRLLSCENNRVTNLREFRSPQFARTAPIAPPSAACAKQLLPLFRRLAEPNVSESPASTPPKDRAFETLLTAPNSAAARRMPVSSGSVLPAQPAFAAWLTPRPKKHNIFSTGQILRYAGFAEYSGAKTQPLIRHDPNFDFLAAGFAKPRLFAAKPLPSAPKPSKSTRRISLSDYDNFEDFQRRL